MIIFTNIIAGQWKYSWQRWWWREPGKMLSPARYPCSWWRIPCSAPGYIIMMNCCWWMMMMMMLTMPTGSNTQGGFDVSRWMERPVVDHLRVLFLRLRFWLFWFYSFFWYWWCNPCFNDNHLPKLPIKSELDALWWHWDGVVVPSIVANLLKKWFLTYRHFSGRNGVWGTFICVRHDMMVKGWNGDRQKINLNWWLKT